MADLPAVLALECGPAGDCVANSEERQAARPYHVVTAAPACIGDKTTADSNRVRNYDKMSGISRQRRGTSPPLPRRRRWRPPPVKLAQVVIVEDETPIREGIVAALQAAGYEAVAAADGDAGLAAARRTGVDLVLLDLMLPKMDGMQVLDHLRKTHPTLPVIILTARGEEDDRVAGLKAGADDYVVKPFSARELIARVEAVLRRSPERPLGVRHLAIGSISIDLERREIRSAAGESQMLSETECSIMAHLAAHGGRAISREEILSRLWGLNTGGLETRTVDMHVARLRAKLTAAGEEPDRPFVVTVRGRGYMLGPDVGVESAIGPEPGSQP